MSQNIVAERYALALFTLAKEQNLVQDLLAEMQTVKKVITENPSFITLLASPKLTLHEKKNVLKDVFSKVSPVVANTLMLLLDSHRQEEMANVAEAYIDLANEENGIEDAIVYSARPLTSDESQAISASFAAKVGKRSLNIENIVDSNLLGGLKIRIGNRIFDGSLRGKLDRLERTLTI
ncbi:F0F1 ATP synthase subunit delta [Lederbergia lenta]|uniref:ATP synthase subunit delta n=1 Tax=Lederbergia lenta TaxID=1467 RepID=A0A2X4WX54_LEDLE|nr:F0F1 ATP synthase subunit delta [Lederbergia lenta]MCM3112052.1 F0F1 ATP synthase subunit delta [Lederbergia lenta]MEC2323222.1 F0F1 ATP synthase subunit delta [Lederbergia lenta]SQI63042.1 ATP synthase F1 subunit delta [Lederbergia lenta]